MKKKELKTPTILLNIEALKNNIKNYILLLLHFFYPNLYEIFMTALTLPNSRFPFGFFKKFSI